MPMSGNDRHFIDETTFPRQVCVADRPGGKLYKAWWAARYHAGVTFLGTPLHFLAATKDGIRAFRREFGRTFSQRWTHGEREEAYRRFTNVR